MSSGADCLVDADCHKLMECVEALCTHKALFPDFETHDLLASIGCFLAVSLASGSGIGGGGLLVPLFILVSGFEEKSAIPLSKATIFGAAVANFIILSRRKHPVAAHRPLIAYDVALMMEPMTLGGTILGVYANRAFPNWLITVLLLLLLSSTTRRTLNKGFKLRKKEQEALMDQDATSGADAAKADFEMVTLTEGESGDAEAGKQHVGAVAERDALQQLYDDEAKPPYKTVGSLVAVWVLLFTLSMLKGGHGAPSAVGLDCGSLEYWLVVLSAAPLLLGITGFFGRQLVRKHQRMEQLGYEYAPGDVVWTPHRAKLYPALCMWAGVAAGMLGIGGGMVKGPLMLDMGMNPQVSSATSAFMILFTSSATTMQFLILGMLKLDYALWFASIGFVSAVVGQKGLAAFLKKSGKTSVIIFVLAFVIGGSALLMGITGVMETVEEGFEEFTAVC